MSLGAVEIRRDQLNGHWTYSALDFRQNEIASRVRKGYPGVLLLSEVAPVITLGKNSASRNFGVSDIEVYPTDRGGQETYHGPGQWVVFAVDRPKELVGKSIGVKETIDRFLEAAWKVSKKYQPSAYILKDQRLGVWSDQGKLASVGISVSQGVVMHGLSLNVYSTPESFRGIKPCGLEAQPDYLMSTENLNQEPHFEKIGQELLEEILNQFW